MEMTFDRFLSAVRTQWKLVLKYFFWTVAIVLLLSLIWPKTYKATASVVIDAKSDPVAGAMGGAGYTDQLLASYVTTQLDVIGSERVAQRVVKMVGLDKDPKMQKGWLKSTEGKGDISIWIADYLISRKLKVAAGQDAAGRSSNVIEISVKWGDPNIAAALANGFAQSAIDTNIELRVEPAKQYATWFEERIKALRADLEAKQKKLSQFQNAQGIVATDEKLDVENNRLNELSSQLSAVQSQRQDSSSRQRQASGDNASLPEVLQSPVIASLKKDLADAESKQQDVASRLGKNHPDYQAAKATVDNLHARLQIETNKIVASLSSTTQVDARRESEIRQALEVQKKRVLELKHVHDDASVLDSDVKSAQAALDAVNLRLSQTALESQNQQTNIVQLSAAAPPINPDTPKLVLNVALAMFAGMIFGFVAVAWNEIRNPRVRSGMELAALAGIPMIGNIPQTRPRAKKSSSLSPLTWIRPTP